MAGKKPEIQGKGISEEIFRAVFDNAPIGNCLVSLEGRFLRVNSAFCHMIGYSENELLSMTFGEVTHPDDLSASNEWVRNLLSGKSTEIDLEKRYLHKTGNVVWGIVRSFLLRDAGGQPLFFSTSIQDITDRKRAEEALRVSEQELRTLVDKNPHGVQKIDISGTIIFANKAHHEIYGYEEGALIGRSITEFLASGAQHDELPGYLEMLVRDQPLPTIYNQIILTKNGEKRDLEVMWDYLRDTKGNVEGFISVLTDITERKRTENKLIENEIRFRAVFENSVDAIGVSKNGVHVFMNPAYLSLFGYTSADELTGKSILDLIAPEERDKIMENVRLRTKGDIVPSVYETIGLKKDATKFDMDVHVSSYEQAGEIFTLAILRDITERKWAEETLKETEERFRILLDQGFDGIFIHRDLIILDMNQRMADISGYSPSELLQSNVINLFTPDSQESIHNYIRSGQKGYYEVKLLRKEGQIVNIEAFGAPCKFHGRSARIVAIRDITEQKKMQEQLRQAQKMESIGHLAGGIAHDFNNILSAIVGYAHLTLMKLKDDDPLRVNIEHILNASDKAANLTQSLLAFSRKQLIVPTPVSINSIVFNMKKILDMIIGEDIDFKVNTSVKDMIVKVDKGQIEHALMNLVTNSRDAMPDGGALTITTEEVSVDEQFIHIHQEGRIGKYAVITISDTGMGMDENTKGSIFEPFFTTKEVGKGTGLGLAMVYGTIKQHNGFINVYSEPGKGTTFKIYLPLAESGVQHKEKEEVTSVSSGNETILLIEDDQAVRRSIKALIEEFGYKVMEAADGDQAITLFRKNKDFLQLVISDVIMPRQSGKEVYDELKKIRPDIKILFISGYSADILTKKGIAGEGMNFISKPIHPEVFCRKIREVLDK